MWNEEYTIYTYQSVREDAIDIAVQEIIGAIEIPAGIVRRLKQKILNCLDELCFVENRLITVRSQRLKEPEHLIECTVI